jgi:3-deoxy-manno-octulosonate cytidylyltransferase (CMP-KDO synthetase)
MIQRVYTQACAANMGSVAVTTPDPEIQACIEAIGGMVIKTDKSCQTGTDRVAKAAARYGASDAVDVIINLQGDMPFVSPQVIQSILTPFHEHTEISMATLACPLASEIRTNPHIVKALWTQEADKTWGWAEDFRRTWPSQTSSQHIMHHIGIYAFRPLMLEHFNALPEAVREKEEKLEQLRAFEHNLKIAVQAVPGPAPLSIDTPEDVEVCKKILYPVPPAIAATA